MRGYPCCTQRDKIGKYLDPNANKLLVATTYTFKDAGINFIAMHILGRYTYKNYIKLSQFNEEILHYQ